MDWTTPIDGYCERLDASYWAEPLNAVTNAAFLIAAAVMWQRMRGQNLPLARALVVVLFAIGVGSYLFHTHARPWAAVLDVAPIALFILLYVFAANLHFNRWPLWLALLGSAAVLPYSALGAALFERLPFFRISGFYWPVPVLIAIYAFWLRRAAPATARGLAAGAGILCLSLVARSLDMPLCARLPSGTHFLWHLLNGLMLGWMIEVYRRHMVAGASPGR